MTGFDSQAGDGHYRIVVETDNRDCYMDVQNVVQGYIDLGHSPCDMCQEFECFGCRYARISRDKNGERWMGE